MLSKSNICGVGPMASVAGAIAEFVGYDLLDATGNLIIEKIIQKHISSFKKTKRCATLCREITFVTMAGRENNLTSLS